MKEVMDKSNHKWNEFLDMLHKEVNFRETSKGRHTWDCDGTLTKTENILREHFPEVDIERSLDFMMQHGGYCDCEVIFNVEDEIVTGDI
jgi:hypothetical protein